MVPDIRKRRVDTHLVAMVCNSLQICILEKKFSKKKAYTTVTQHIKETNSDLKRKLYIIIL